MTDIVDRMSHELDHTNEVEAEAAEILKACAQMASGWVVTDDPIVQLTSERQTLDFYRRVRKHVFSKTLRYAGTREELDRIVGDLEDSLAITLSVCLEGNITTVSASCLSLQDVRKTADAAKDYFAASTREQDQKKRKQARRLHAV